MQLRGARKASASDTKGLFSSSDWLRSGRRAEALRCSFSCSLDTRAILGPSFLKMVMTISATVGEKLITAQVRVVAGVPFQIHPSSMMAVENCDTRPLRSRAGRLTRSLATLCPARTLADLVFQSTPATLRQSDCVRDNREVKEQDDDYLDATRSDTASDTPPAF